MLCDRCKKNIASNYYKQDINGKIYEYHLCDECAKNLTKVNLFLDDLLGSLLSSNNNLSAIPNEINICEKCGATPDDISKCGKIGCSNCYTKFRNILMPSIKKIHVNTKHVGNIPSSFSCKTSSQITLLKSKLDIAIKKQEFELAAEIRDKINDLKKAGETSNGE